MTSIKFTAKQAVFYVLIAVCLLLMTVFTGSVYAQPEVTFEFKNTFGKKIITFGSQGSAVGQFNAPVGVDVDALGRIWVADTGNHRIQACDYEGSCVAFGELGTGEGQFELPKTMSHCARAYKTAQVPVHINSRTDQ